MAILNNALFANLSENKDSVYKRLCGCRPRSGTVGTACLSEQLHASPWPLSPDPRTWDPPSDPSRLGGGPGRRPADSPPACGHLCVFSGEMSIQTLVRFIAGLSDLLLFGGKDSLVSSEPRQVCDVHVTPPLIRSLHLSVTRGPVLSFTEQSVCFIWRLLLDVV